MRSAHLICAGLLLMFAALAWFAAATKSPAYDEPYHAMSAWLQLHFHDFRFDNEDPPLWQYWASLPNGRSAITANFDDPDWITMPQHLVQQWYWGAKQLYRTSGNDPVRFIAHCRAMMLILAVFLGGLICYWSWQIAGPIAAVVAAVFFCLDPNFLAHSALMKNDVAFAMSFFFLVFALWRGGKKLDLWAIASIAILCVVTLTVKFSGMIAVTLVPLLLGARTILPQAWPVLGRMISNRFHRLLVAVGVTVLAMCISYLGIWAVYGFRFQPTPENNTWLNLPDICNKVRRNQALVDHKASVALPLTARAAMFANDHRLLPQAFVAGFLFTYANALIRCDYLCGQISYTGWWWYFPFAMLVKTPIATLLAALSTGFLAIGAAKRGRLKDRQLQWTVICLTMPVIVFLASAMTTHLNIGIRHVLGLYPFAFVAIGCAGASAWQSRGKKARFTLIGLGLLLAIESLSAYPNYIPFFNCIAANVPGGKFWLLGDSNLDWGQDIPLLVDWQQQHPNDTLYLSYFGYADPKFYGLKYLSLPGGYYYDAKRKWVDPYTHSFVAISASNLQGLLMEGELSNYYAQWRKRRPIAVLGDSIYIFEYDPMQKLNGGPAVYH